MKTTKPNNMSLLFRTNILEGKDILTISAFATFTFSTKEPRLLADDKLWEVVEQNLAKDEIFDAGQPKPRSEYLVYGSAYSSKPVAGLGTFVQVGNLSKTLVVIGDRYWTALGISEPFPFTKMKINYSNAFGGKDFNKNIFGKGIDANQEGKILLPNVEDPNNPITSKSSKPEPASLTAYPIDSPQRTKHIGKITSQYIAQEWPGFPKGTNPEYFNVAPEDQRFKGFITGTEKFTIKNMHEKLHTQVSQLPCIRLRVFVIQKHDDGTEHFKEIKNTPETLWLFPNQEVGTLLFRANLEVKDEEYSDVIMLFAAWESMNEMPKTLEYYYNEFTSEESEEQEVSDKEINKNEDQEISTPNNSTANLQSKPAVKDEVLPDPEFDEALNKLKAQQNNPNADKAIQANITQQVADGQKGQSSVPLEESLKKLNKLKEDLQKQNKLSDNELNKFLPQNNVLPSNVPSDQLNEALAAIAASAELETDLNNLINLSEKINTESEQEQNKQDKVLVKPEIKPQPPATKPILQKKLLTRSDVIEKYSLNKDLRNLDLSNLDLRDLDLSYANFENSNLSRTLLSNTNLSYCKFTKNIMININLNQANLDFATITDCYAGLANFSDASLQKIKINESDFSGSDFSNCTFEKAQLNMLNLEKSNLTNCNFISAKLNNCLLANCEISQGNFSNATLEHVDFSAANLGEAKFILAVTDETNFAACYGNNINFNNANLAHSRADQDTILTNAILKNTNLSFATWENAQLEAANMSGANLDNANFSGANLAHANLELVSAKNTNFSKSNLKNADLNRINLLNGSFRKAILVETDLRYSNLHGVDFYKAQVGQTKLKGANLTRTLLSTYEITPEII